MSNTVTVPQLAWHGDTQLTLKFPADWDVIVCKMAGHDKPALPTENVQKILSNPIGTKTIAELAEERRECVIIFDDMTRPTKIFKFLPFILKELKKGGISDGHIRFINALGAHGANNRIDFVKKLGEDIVERYPVYNHNPFGNLEDLGTTSRGTPVSANAEVMQCDLKIGIGSILPHLYGFSGGAKIISPGIVSIDTICHNHYNLGGYGLGGQPHPTTGYGKDDGDNIVRLDMEETAEMVGLDIKIDEVMNIRRETVGLFAGHFTKEFREGLKLAREVYTTEVPRNMDVVVVNAYAKSNEAVIAMWAGIASVREGGDVVLIANNPEGQVTHYILGKFGKKLGGRLYAPLKAWAKIKRLIVLSPNRVADPFLELCPQEQIVWIKTWDEVLEELKSTHKGRVKTAVYPDATMQMAKK